jgi:hypothetical protein
MKARIHSVDRERRDSEGTTLYLPGAPITVVVKPYEGLPFGERKDQHYLEVEASGWDGNTHSTLTAELDGDDLYRLLNAAVEAQLIDLPVSQRVVQLLEQLRHELTSKAVRR